MANGDPVLSIAVLTYKHENYIREALDGVFMQKLNVDHEIVIADDKSPDNTQAIIKEYVEKYPDRNIRTIFQDPNVGMWQNIKTLFNALKGDYFAFVEGDDYWTDDTKLQQQLDILQADPELVCCFHAAKVIKEKESKNILKFNRYPEVAPPQITTLLDILEHGNYIPSASMLQRNVNKGNFPEYIFDKRSYPDTMLHLTQAAHGKYYYIDKEMSVYRINVGGITEDRTNIGVFLAKVHMYECSDEYTKGKWHTEHRSAIQKYYYWILDYYVKEGNRKEALKYLKLIKENKEFDKQFHINFLRKVWLEVSIPGAKALLRSLGK